MKMKIMDMEFDMYEITEIEEKVSDAINEYTDAPEEIDFDIRVTIIARGRDE